MVNVNSLCGLILLFLAVVLVFGMLRMISKNLSERQLLFTGVSLVLIALFMLAGGVMICT